MQNSTPGGSTGKIWGCIVWMFSLNSGFEALSGTYYFRNRIDVSDGAQSPKSRRACDVRRVCLPGECHDPRLARARAGAAPRARSGRGHRFDPGGRGARAQRPQPAPTSKTAAKETADPAERRCSRGDRELLRTQAIEAWPKP